MTPYHRQLCQYQNYAPKNFYGMQLVQQPQPSWLILQNVPEHNSGGTQVPSPMQLFKPTLSTMINNVQHGSWVHAQQSVFQSKGFDFLGHLKGSFDTGVPEASKIEVVIVAEGNQRYAVVRSARCEEDAVPHQFICEQDTRITLCSMDGYVEAVMLKRWIMKDHLK